MDMKHIKEIIRRVVVDDCDHRHLNIRDNVDVPLRYRGFDGAERARRIDRVLDLVGLSSRGKHLPSQP